MRDNEMGLPPVDERGSRSRAPNRAEPTVSVIIPTRNEAANLPSVLAGLPAEYEVVVVDGHSVDGTVDVARACRPEARIVVQSRRGKGNAMVCGFHAATGDVLVMLDADGSADPAEIPAFVQALEQGADFAKGTRFASGGGSSDITPTRALGNRALTGLVNVLFGVRYSDLCYGYNAFWSRLVPALELPSPTIECTDDAMIWGDGFEIETLLNVRVAAAGARISEVGSVEQPRLHGESNLNATRDGLRVLRTIMAERWRLVCRDLRAQRRRHEYAAPPATATANSVALSAPREARWAMPRALSTSGIGGDRGCAAEPDVAGGTETFSLGRRAGAVP